MKKAGVVSMGQRPAGVSDIELALRGVAEVSWGGILDGYTRERVDKELWPREGEGFIVSTLDGQEVRIAEEKAMAMVNALLLQKDAEGCDGGLILCTGHFEPPQTNMTLLVPERILFSLFQGLGIKRLGAIVPQPEQIPMSLDYYKDYNPIVRASSPYGSREALAQTARLFAREDVDLILTDCMGFTAELGNIVSGASGKRVLVPRVVLPALLGSLLV